MCVKPALEQPPGRTCGPVGTGPLSGADLLLRLVTLGKTYAGVVCSWTAPRGRDPHWSSSCTCGKDSHWEGVSHGKAPTLKSRKSVRRKYKDSE